MPPSASSSMHSASPKRSRTRRGFTPESGEAGPVELKSASSSGIDPTLATRPVMARGRRGLSEAKNEPTTNWPGLIDLTARPAARLPAWTRRWQASHNLSGPW